MHLAFAAEPCILVRKFLWSHKLSEAIINHNFVIMELALSFSSFIRIYFAIQLWAHKVFIEGPTFIRVDADLEFKLEIIELLFGWGVL